MIWIRDIDGEVVEEGATYTGHKPCPRCKRYYLDVPPKEQCWWCDLQDEKKGKDDEQV